MGVFFYLLFYLQSFDICGRVSAIRKALVMLCSSQVSQAVTVTLRAQEYDSISFAQMFLFSCFI